MEKRYVTLSHEDSFMKIVSLTGRARGLINYS